MNTTKTNAYSTEDLNDLRKFAISKIDSLEYSSENQLRMLAFSIAFDKMINNVNELESIENSINTHAELLIDLCQKKKISYNTKYMKEKHSFSRTPLKPFNLIPKLVGNTANSITDWMNDIIHSGIGYELQKRNLKHIENLNSNIRDILFNTAELGYIINKLNIHSDLLMQLCSDDTIPYIYGYPEPKNSSIDDPPSNTNGIIPAFTCNSKDALNCWVINFIQNLENWTQKKHIIEEYLGDNFGTICNKMDQFDGIKNKFNAHDKLLTELQKFN